MDIVTMFYIGSFIDSHTKVDLCISDDIRHVQYYLKFVRGLDDNQMSIVEVELTYQIVNDMYGKLLLVEYDDVILYLTTMDINILSKEMTTALSEYEISIHKAIEAVDELLGNSESKYYFAVASKEALDVIEDPDDKILYNIIKKSPILSRVIWQYIHYSRVCQEMQELDNRFSGKYD